jgi:MGT family glycosyltransferase
MAHFGIITPPLRGHLDPAVALALALAERGHRVTLFSDAALPPPAPIGFHPVATRHGTAGFEALMAAVTGLNGLGGTLRAMAERADDLCDALPAALRETGVEALLVDQTEPAGALVAQHLGLPYASLGLALPLNREEGVPPPYVGWRYRADGSGDWLNRGAYAVVDAMMRPLSATLRRRAAGFRLPPVRRMEDAFSPSLQLLQCTRGFDYPRQALPAGVHYLGPFRQPLDETAWTPPEGERPLVFCSLGTIQGHRIEVFRAAALAVAERGLRLLAVHVGRLSPAQVAELSALPGEPIIVHSVPQRAVLRHAHAAILHGGFNSVLDALEAGVPVAVVPLAFEQAANAARLAWCGAGVAVAPGQVARSLGKALLGKALDRLDGCRPAARRMAAEIAQCGGAPAAAGLLELWLRREQAGGG